MTKYARLDKFTMNLPTKYFYTTHPVFPALISSPPHISEHTELIFLNVPVFKASLYHVSLLRY